MSDLHVAATQDLSLLAFECLARLAVAGVAGVLPLGHTKIWIEKT